MQGAALAGAVTAIQAIYKASCILECGQSLMHLSCAALIRETHKFIIVNKMLLTRNHYYLARMRKG